MFWSDSHQVGLPPEGSQLESRAVLVGIMHCGHDLSTEGPHPSIVFSYPQSVKENILRLRVRRFCGWLGSLFVQSCGINVITEANKKTGLNYLSVPVGYLHNEILLLKLLGLQFTVSFVF